MTRETFWALAHLPQKSAQYIGMKHPKLKLLLLRKLVGIIMTVLVERESIRELSVLSLEEARSEKVNQSALALQMLDEHNEHGKII